MFESQETVRSLHEVLTAYSNIDKELGYTQGMSIIAANIFRCYDISHNDLSLEGQLYPRLVDTEILDNRDETVYYIFHHIMIRSGWRTLFLDGMPGLFTMITILKERMLVELPELYRHLSEQQDYDYT